MKKLLVVLSLSLSLGASASCGDFEGIASISMSSTSPWFLTTFMMTGNDPLTSCKFVREIRSDAQKALIDGSEIQNPRLKGMLQEMNKYEENRGLSLEEKLEKIIEETTKI